jgi:uncharacterized phage-associated protein
MVIKDLMKKTPKVRPEELITYILANFNNEHLTETKLNKLLYFCDFDYYEKYQSPITTSIYVRNNYGPTVKDLKDILDRMIEKGLIKEVKETNYFGSPQTRYSIISDKIKFSFTEEEIQVIKDVNEKYRELKPTELSSISHFDPPFLSTRLGGTINYKHVLFRDDSVVSDEERESWKDFLNKEEKGKLVALAE